MENRINVAELLKDCPKGMELDCVLYENVTFRCILDDNCYPIQVETPEGYMLLSQYGCMSLATHAKCVIFPKGKTTWEGFVPPCKFKDGDVLATDIGSIFMLKEPNENVFYYSCYVALTDASHIITSRIQFCAKSRCRLATEDEKRKLFDAIKANGCKWNAETKTLEKLIEPNFKVGDIIQDIDSYKVKITDVNTEDECYEYESMIAKGIGSIAFSKQDEWKFVPNKFNITTLIPFESRVLVRDYDNRMWMPTFWGKRLEGNFNCSYLTANGCYRYCIPYEGNQHLLGKTDDCDEFYKTWE